MIPPKGPELRIPVLNHKNSGHLAKKHPTPEPRLKLEPNSKSKPELDDKPEPRADPEEPKLESKNRESHAGFEET